MSLPARVMGVSPEGVELCVLEWFNQGDADAFASRYIRDGKVCLDNKEVQVLECEYYCSRMQLCVAAKGLVIGGIYCLEMRR